ncbi:MAG: CHASE2 domain-containing serine/threonine-protein kinase [Nevskiales bacterium]
MKKSIWASDGFAGLAFVVVFFALAYWVLADGFQSLERYAYDVGMRAAERDPSPQVAVIAIDDESIENIGRWPWPRDLHGKMIELLHQGGAAVIGNTVLYSEAQKDAGLVRIEDLLSYVGQTRLRAYLPQAPITPAPAPDAAVAASVGVPPAAAPSPASDPELAGIVQRLLDARQALNTDASLAASLQKAGNVVQGMAFILGVPQGKPAAELPESVQASTLRTVTDPLGLGDQPIPALAALPPIPMIASAVNGIGHVSAAQDVDGAQRFEPLVLNYYNSYYPSLSLMVAARVLNLNMQDIEVRLGEGVTLGGLTIGTTPDLRMYTFFYGDRGGKPAFSVDSFYDVLSGKIPPQKYHDKIVLLGASAQGVGDSFPTPISASTPPVLTLAHTVSSILQEDFITRPEWAGVLELGLMLLLALYVAFVLPRVRAGIAFGLTLVLLVGFVGTHLYLMTQSGIWLKLMIPAALLALGHLFMTVKLFRVTEKLKVKSEAEGAESNKMLGLAFQGQGQLDMAFEKFRRVQPVDDGLLDVMYNLALDYERKRQFNKAENVYQYIARHNPKFRDAGEKGLRAKQMSETIILGGGGAGSTAGGTSIMQGSQVEKPMLGRYQIEKELGRGAMGMVYLGKDPKIGRQVAIKTMALSQEFEASELADVKARFFREAESAGKLTHPNIVTMFDAGEEHDLAYIAMEFISGHDLTRYARLDSLLPAQQVMKLIAQAADALDYAHTRSVVHRDIKPANLMYLPDEEKVKITDFGIARVTDSSKTKTGTVLGTPSYMSPEQLSGKKVDGRSDLFSLGVTLYQMLTGQLPFAADSMATLMYKIANEAQAPPSEVRTQMPACADAIIAKALQKDPDARYQRGAELAQDLRQCAG